MNYRLVKAYTGDRTVTALRESFKDKKNRRCEKLVAVFFDSNLSKKVLRWLEKDGLGGKIIE